MKLIKTVIFGLFMGLAPLVCNGMESDDSDSFDIPEGLQQAIKSNDINQVQQILHENEPVDTKTLSYLLRRPVKVRNVEMTQYLINNKADIDYLNPKLDNMSLLNDALEAPDDIERVQFIMQFNPNVNQESREFGDTALHWAAQDIPEIVHIILEAKANVNQPNYAGKTPLKIAAKRSSYAETIHLLTQHGAIVTDDIIEAQEGNSELDDMEPARKNIKNLNTNLSIACQNGTIEQIQQLINANASVNAYDDESKCTPLLKALICDNFEVLEFLLNAQADPNIVGAGNMTPLFWAIHNFNPQTITLLMNNGVVIDTKSQEYARTINPKINFSIEQFLQEAITSRQTTLKLNSMFRFFSKNEFSHTYKRLKQ